MKEWSVYQEANKERFLEELLALLRIPSISAKSEHNGDMLACAKAVEQSLKDAGASATKIYETPGHPIVYGELITNPSLPTVLVYGHYDVQPADPLDLWKSGPFEPTIIDGKIFARGACDDKGQFYMHVKALETMVKTNNGFEIAEVDLELRGPGDVLGTRQSGLPDFKLLDLVKDEDIIDLAKRASAYLLKNDPELTAPEHQSLLAYLQQHQDDHFWSRVS